MAPSDQSLIFSELAPLSWSPFPQCQHLPWLRRLFRSLPLQLQPPSRLSPRDETVSSGFSSRPLPERRARSLPAPSHSAARRSSVPNLQLQLQPDHSLPSALQRRSRWSRESSRRVVELGL